MPFKFDKSTPKELRDIPLERKFGDFHSSTVRKMTARRTKNVAARLQMEGHSFEDFAVICKLVEWYDREWAQYGSHLCEEPEIRWTDGMIKLAHNPGHQQRTMDAASEIVSEAIFKAERERDLSEEA